MDLFSRSPDIYNGVSRHIETVVQLFKGDIDRGSFERSDAVKAGDFGMIIIECAD
jgi:hypothetical protein